MFEFIFAVCLLIASAPSVQAQDIREERVQFDPGTSGTIIEGRISGYESVDYILGASVGQEMNIEMVTSNLSNYFNVMIGNDPAAIHIGSTNGNKWSGTLPETADYRIRVYLMRNAARRDETSNYSLSIKIGARNEDFADGLTGGPDYWEVSNVGSNDTLNVRAGPGIKNEIVGELVNGDRARNLGCKMVGNARWCRIEAGFDMKFAGWVNGRYLREASSNRVENQATGQIPCSTAVGQPTRQCGIRVTRGSNGNAGIWVDIGERQERYIEFRSGEPITSEAGLEVIYDKSGDLYLIRMGEVERYEVPEAVVYGG